MKSINDIITESAKETTKQVTLTSAQISAIENVIADCRWQKKSFNATGDDCGHISVSMSCEELDALLSIKF